MNPAAEPDSRAAGTACREQVRLRDADKGAVPWRKWGPYLSERQWGTVREDYSRDGSDDNHRWNCGAECPTDDAGIEALRNRQVKNFLALTLLAAGTPMLLMGDEVRRSQRGNNNAYCSDDESAWFDWSALERHADVHRFVRQLIGVRMARTLPVERLEMTLNERLAANRIDWHGVDPTPDWSDTSHGVAATLRCDADGMRLHIMVNAYWEPLAFALPPLEADFESWRCCVDTLRAPPADILAYAEAEPVTCPAFTVQPRSLAVLAVRGVQSSRGADRIASAERRRSDSAARDEGGLS